MDAQIRSAISQKKLVQFIYKGHARIAELHVYGRKNGVDQVLTYQTGGSSSRGGLPSWRRCNLADMREFALLGETFAGARETGELQGWDHVYLEVE